MHIKKQRLLTPGPTPLLPKALHAMMESDVHHRTEAFRKIYAAVLADLKEVFGTKNEVLSLVASGTGAMEASVSNFFSRGDKVIVCSAGKFGERWAEIAKAYGLDATVLTKEYGDAVSADEVADTLKKGRSTKAYSFRHRRPRPALPMTFKGWLRRSRARTRCSLSTPLRASEHSRSTLTAGVST